MLSARLRSNIIVPWEAAQASEDASSRRIRRNVVTLRTQTLLPSMSAIRTRILSGFSDPACSSNHWQALLRQGPTNVVYLTWQWQRAWWETHGQGRLLLVAAERDGRMVALAPLYCFESGIYFIGAGEAEYTDFIGDCSDPEVLAALVSTARDAADGLEDMKLHLMPQTTPTLPRLADAAARLGLEMILLRQFPAAEIDLTADEDAVRGAVSRTMLEKENYFRRHGELEVSTLTDVAEIRPLLPAFYAHHVRRWTRKDRPSEFVQAKHRNMLERFLDLAADTGWVRICSSTGRGSSLRPSSHGITEARTSSGRGASTWPRRTIRPAAC